jgi:hypothetical protein
VYNIPIVMTIHRLSAWLFYALGVSFFVAYLLLQQGMTPWPGWWLRSADLPLITVALLYGGTSLYRSVTRPEKPSKPLAIGIAIPLLALFTFLLALNFWPVLPSM